MSTLHALVVLAGNIAVAGGVLLLLVITGLLVCSFTDWRGRGHRR